MIFQTSNQIKIEFRLLISIINPGNNKNRKDKLSIGLRAIKYGFLLPHLVYLESLTQPKKNYEPAIVNFPRARATPI